MNQSLVPFGAYVRLYTLNQVEHSPDWLVVRVRLVTLRYTFAPLNVLPLDDAYAEDPREGSALVRAVVLPRLQGLLDAPDPFRELRLDAVQEPWWQRYAAERGLPVQPVRPPAIHIPSAHRLPARSRTAERLARVQQALELAQTAAETASTLAAAWQNWQIGRERRKLIAAQRDLLHDAIQAQLDGQGRALDRGLDRGFVRGYLADHAADEGYDAVFGEDETG